MEHTFIVENIKCGGCVKSITNRIMENKNVSNVGVDIENQTIQIETHSPEDRNNFLALLLKMGYPEQGNNNIGAKVKSYVSCAIGKF